MHNVVWNAELWLFDFKQPLNRQKEMNFFVCSSYRKLEVIQSKRMISFQNQGNAWAAEWKSGFKILNPEVSKMLYWLIF